jgi:hypothetical protein
MNFDHIKNKAKAFRKDDRIIIYVNSRIDGRSLFDIQHRLRVRQLVFGYIFTSYHPDMDFTLALSLGWVEI